MQRLITGLAVSALAVAGVTVFGPVDMAGGQGGHPGCGSFGGNLVDSLRNGDSTSQVDSVTFSGNEDSGFFATVDPADGRVITAMFIKSASDHQIFDVEPDSADPVTRKSTDQNPIGKYQEISHVDVCIAAQQDTDGTNGDGDGDGTNGDGTNGDGDGTAGTEGDDGTAGTDDETANEQSNLGDTATGDDATGGDATTSDEQADPGDGTTTEDDTEDDTEVKGETVEGDPETRPGDPAEPEEGQPRFTG